MNNCALVGSENFKNLYIELVRNRTKTLYLMFGYWQYSGPYFFFAENPLPRADYFPPNWIPTDITGWRFSFNMTQAMYNNQSLTSSLYPPAPSNYPNLVYDPLVNLSDPTTGILTWNIRSVDTVGLPVGNYYFEMTISTDGYTIKTLSSGVIALIDNLNDFVSTASIYRYTPLSIFCNSQIQFNLEKQ